jgi:hypothetical protein
MYSIGVVFAGASMIETNILQQQQQDKISKQPSHPEAEAVAETGVTITCAICDAMYAPSPQQVPFLQYTQGALEATFMGTCHFCFRCRRAACPQCWDDVHGVCGSCVREAGLPFRAGAIPLDGLTFPPTSQPSSLPTQQQQSSSLFVPVRNGRFYSETPARPELAKTDITTAPALAIQPVVAQNSTLDNHTADKNQIDPPIAVAIPTKTPVPEAPQDTRKQEETSHTTKKTKRASHLELVFTWIVLVIVLLLVVVTALAEFIPAVNTLVLHVTHIDIHAEIAYLVHIVRQLFKR